MKYQTPHYPPPTYPEDGKKVYCLLLNVSLVPLCCCWSCAKCLFCSYMPWNARDTSKASNPKYKRFLAYTDPGPGKGSCLFATNRDLKKHEIAHVTAQLQAQVKLLLSRKHNNEMFSELQMRGQVICDDCCEVELIYCCCLSLISARSQQSKFANFSSPGTAALQNCES